MEIIAMWDSYFVKVLLGKLSAITCACVWCCVVYMMATTVYTFVTETSDFPRECDDCYRD